MHVHVFSVVTAGMLKCRNTSDESAVKSLSSLSSIRIYWSALFDIPCERV